MEDYKEKEDRFKADVIDALFAGKIVDAFPEMEFVEGKDHTGNRVWNSRHHLDGREDKQKKFVTVVGERAKFNVHHHPDGRDRGIIDLYMDQNNIDYKEARKQLSRITGVALPEGDGGGTGAGNSNTELAKQNSRMGAEKAFKAALWSGTDEAKKALDYLRNGRGLNDEQIKKMGIGILTRSSFDLLDENARSECEYTSKTDGKKRMYFDREGLALAWAYRTGGKIAGFKFRSIDNKVFLNSQGLPKSGPLFNLNTRQKVAIVVESELDALLAQSEGIENVVATAGGAMSEEQIADARAKGVKQFVLFFDNDEDEDKGPKYTKDTIRLLNDDDNVKVVTGLPAGVKDIGEYLQQYDVESLKAIISKAESAFAYKFKNEIPADQMATAEQFYRKEQERRRIEAQGKELLKKAEQLFESGQVDEALALMGETSKALRIRAREDFFKKIFAKPSAGEVEQMFSELNEGLPTGIRFGETPLQETLTLNPGLTFICGRSGHGKTSVLNCITLNEAGRNLAMGNGKQVLYFSYEINKKRLMLDLLNTYVDNPSISISPYNSIMSYYKPKPGEPKDAGFHDYSREPRPEDRDPNKKQNNYEDFLNKKKVFIPTYLDNGAIVIVEEKFTVEDLLDAITYETARNDVSLICVDYAQLIYSEQYSRQRTEEIKKIVQDIKDFADANQIPVVMAAQFNQQVDVPANVKLTNIGEGGDFARIADTVVGIFNLEKFDLEVIEAGDKALKPLHKFGITHYGAGDDGCQGKMYMRLLKRRYGISDLDTIVDWRGPSKKFVPNYPDDLNVDAIQASLQLTESDEAKRKADEAEREKSRSKW